MPNSFGVFYSAFLAIGILLSTTVWAEHPETRANPSLDHDPTEQISGFDQQGFYLATPNLDPCVSPLCGGLYIEPVNHYRMRCPDGRRARQCYIAQADWSALGGNPFTEGDPINPNAYLLQGKVVPKDYEGFGNLGLFVATAAYRAVTSNPPRGRFIGLENKGIFCISSPCFSLQEYYLNQNRQRAISGFDLNGAGATEREQEQARAIMGNDGVLIAVGRNQYVEELNGTGITFNASQFYLPITFDERACDAGYEARNGVCVTPIGCEAPLLEQTELGGALMIDPITGEEKVDIQYRCVTRCEEPAMPSGPARCTLALP